MTVKELIDKLKTLTSELEKLQQDDEIWIDVADWEYWVDWATLEKYESSSLNWWVVKCNTKC